MIILVAALLSTQALGKSVECKTNMKGKKSEQQYCTKFGVAAHATLLVGINSRVLNAPHLTVSGMAEMVKFEIGVFADQEYDRFTSKTTCYEKRKAAAQLIQLVAPVDGGWSQSYNHTDNQFMTKIANSARPKMYYFELLDCSGEVNRVFKTG